jgi:hypothetical protein
MDDAQQASEAGRQLARSRWGDTRLRGAVSLISDRRDELDGPLIDELRAAIAGSPAKDGDDR